MRKKSSTGIIAMCLIIACACGPKHGDGKKDVAAAEKIADPQNTSVRVPLAVAKEDIKRYDSACTAMFSKTGVPIRAYTIHAADLLEVLGLPKSEVASCTYSHARVYLGLDPAFKFKLYFTPVVGADLDPDKMAAGRDTILSDPATGADGYYVFDLNAPCPKTCDEGSQLYNP